LHPKTNWRPDHGTAEALRPAPLSPRPGASQGRAHRPGAPRRSFVSSAGFTLIEMIVVILLIAILLGISTGMLATAKERARASVSRDTAKQIADAWVRHLHTVGEWPTAVVENTDETQYLETKAAHLAMLNRMSGGNPADGYYFLELKQQEKDEGLKDSWGSYFLVFLDKNYDGQIPYPSMGEAAGSEDEEEEEVAWIKAAAVVLSIGKDKTPGTKDDILVF